ncbi:hypothetical protein KFK09_004275 [Dendrobium nobile]|uniref:RNase H type-1 domain-containing protein n=1 Tax=Dendrobium nobile TaxID=94219 RepID=A0A8T3C4Y7_DENNO|nr:hypothetical protein KFK09_004275 [Dendrobium nobile]
MDNNFKLNVHDCMVDNAVGCGGLIKDSNGKLVLAFAGPIINGNVEYAMCMTILYGLQLCIPLNVTTLIIEVNSGVNISYLQFMEDRCCNLSIFYIVWDIKKLLIFMNSSFTVIAKAANAAAIWLANFGCNLDGFTDFGGSSMPFPLTGLLHLDQLGIPYVSR